MANPFGDHWKNQELTPRYAIPNLPDARSIDEFLQAIRSSCDLHARRKGYMNDDGNVAGDLTAKLGIARNHALGEIIYKVLEFQHMPRRVIAEKIAGWAWRLWLTADE